MNDVQRLIVARDLWARKARAIVSGVRTEPLVAGAVIAAALDVVAMVRPVLS